MVTLATPFVHQKEARVIAKETLCQGLQIAQEKNIKKTLVTCSVNNPASRAVILANGGLLEDVRNGVERYWIEVANE